MIAGRVARPKTEETPQPDEKWLLGGTSLEALRKGVGVARWLSFHD